jgi:CarboxypepD_reg-like domain
MKTLNLTIPTPCSEKWENFTPTAAGGHCGSCNEIVIDFTKMTDDEVISYFHQQRGHTCGRFRPHQLKIYHREEMVPVRPGMMLLKAGMVSLLFALISKQSFAQERISAVKTEIVDTSSQKNLEPKKDPKGQTITGVVMARGETDPLAGVNVILQGTQVGTVTDENGRFVFPQKLKEGDVLVFYFIGMEPNEYVVQKDTGAPVEIRMMCEFEIMGKLMIDTTDTPEPSAFQKVISKVKRIF